MARVVTVVPCGVCVTALEGAMWLASMGMLGWSCGLWGLEEGAIMMFVKRPRGDAEMRK